jgi:peptidylprolyl isomerase domain and WD repeat-containing protein 1
MASESETTAVSTITSATVDDGGAHESKRELGSGAASTTSVGQEEEDMIGPGPAPAKQRQKRPLQFEQAFLDALPSAAMCVFA